MDSGNLLIVASALVIGFHLFDIMAHRLRIPSVVLLLAAGMLLKIVLEFFEVSQRLPDGFLQGLGVLGLALIVLEGSMGLRWSKGSSRSYLRAGLAATGGIILFLAMAAPILHWVFDLRWKSAILHAIPLSVISSAIAIPSASRLSNGPKEFISIESSLSDILGVLVFNAVVLPGALGASTLFAMGWRSLSVIAGSTLVIAVLLKMLRHSKHHVRFLPLLAVLILFYAIGKQAHLPSLLLVFLFGVAFANVELLPPGPLRDAFVRQEFEQDATLLKTLVAETAFLARTFFFFLFGFSMDLSSLGQPLSLGLGFVMLSFIYLGRIVILKALGIESVRQVFFIAPRGLITVLLMGMIPAYQLIPEIASGSVLVVILGTTLIQLFGGRDVARAAGMPELEALLPIDKERRP